MADRVRTKCDLSKAADTVPERLAQRCCPEMIAPVWAETLHSSSSHWSHSASYSILPLHILFREQF